MFPEYWLALLSICFFSQVTLKVKTTCCVALQAMGAMFSGCVWVQGTTRGGHMPACQQLWRRPWRIGGFRIAFLSGGCLSSTSEWAPGSQAAEECGSQDTMCLSGFILQACDSLLESLCIQLCNVFMLGGVCCEAKRKGMPEGSGTAALASPPWAVVL